MSTRTLALRQGRAGGREGGRGQAAAGRRQVGVRACVRACIACGGGMLGTGTGAYGRTHSYTDATLYGSTLCRRPPSGWAWRGVVITCAVGQGSAFDHEQRIVRSPCMSHGMPHAAWHACVHLVSFRVLAGFGGVARRPPGMLLGRGMAPLHPHCTAVHRPLPERVLRHQLQQAGRRQQLGIRRARVVEDGLRVCAIARGCGRGSPRMSVGVAWRAGRHSKPAPARSCRSAMVSGREDGRGNAPCSVPHTPSTARTRPASAPPEPAHAGSASCSEARRTHTQLLSRISKALRLQLACTPQPHVRVHLPALGIAARRAPPAAAAAAEWCLPCFASPMICAGLGLDAGQASSTAVTVYAWVQRNSMAGLARFSAVYTRRWPKVSWKRDLVAFYVRLVSLTFMLHSCVGFPAAKELCTRKRRMARGRGRFCPFCRMCFLACSPPK